MHKEVLRGIEGIGLYPVISLLIFVMFFVTMFLWVLRMRNLDTQTYAKMPLDDGDAPTPLQGDKHHG